VALLAFVVGRLLGEEAGLVAALMAAVSPVDVTTSHQVRPDVLLQSFGLVGVAALRGVGPRLSGDARMGLAIGLASAIKFTGLLLVPSYLFARLSRPGPRLRGLVVAGAVTIATAVACTPYALLHLGRYRDGPPQQLRQYYPAPVTRGMVLRHLRYFVASGVAALGPIGAASFMVGAVVLLRRSWREWGPPLLHPLATVAVMSTGSLVFPRYILPAMGAVHLAASVPYALLARGGLTRVLAAGLLLLEVARPYRSSADYVFLASRESAQDKALDWILAHLDRGARILETRGGASPGGVPGAMIGLPPERYEVVFHYSEDDARNLLPLLAPHMDLVVMYPGEGWKALRTAYVAQNAVGSAQGTGEPPRVPAGRPEGGEAERIRERFASRGPGRRRPGHVVGHVARAARRRVDPGRSGPGSSGRPHRAVARPPARRPRTRDRGADQRRRPRVPGGAVGIGASLRRLPGRGGLAAEPGAPDQAETRAGGADRAARAPSRLVERRRAARLGSPAARRGGGRWVSVT
jgi:hypothetical protein